MATLPSNLALTVIADGALAVAADVRNDFSAIQTETNALLGILGGGAAGQVLTGVGTTMTWAYGSGVYRKTSEKDVVSTVTETDLLNSSVTIGAGVLGTDRMLRAVLIGDYLNNSGANRTFTLKVKLGATTLFQDDSVSLTAGATRRPWRIEFELANLGAPNSQFLFGKVDLGINTAPTTGIGDLYTNDMNGPWGTSGTAAVDTSSAQALAVTVTHSAADANLSMRLKYAVVEVI